MSPSSPGPDDAIATQRRSYDLRAIGWTFDIRHVGDGFMHGVGTPD